MRPGRPGRIHLLAFAALALACATPAGLPAPREDLPRRVHLDDVPFHAQRTDQCGPAALAMLLAASGAEVSPDTLVREVYLPGRRGSLQPDLVAAARRHGQLAVTLSGWDALLDELAAGRPVLVLQDLGIASYHVWHYAVAIGYDLEAGSIALHSGDEAARREALRSFSRSWSRADYWGLVTLPPGELPFSADERTVLDAVVGLERAGRAAEARAAYAAATTRWPASLGAWLGLGNTAYQLGDRASAESAFRRAAELHPDAAGAFNNLAVVLLDLGRRGDALAAAERAVELGGPQAEQYAETLATVRAARD